MRKFVLPALLALCLLPVAVAAGHKKGTYTGQFTDPASAGNSFQLEATKKKAKGFAFQIKGSCSDGTSYTLTVFPNPSIQARINKKDKFDGTFPTDQGVGEIRISGKFKKKRASGFADAQQFFPATSVTCTTGEQGWTAKK